MSQQESYKVASNPALAEAGKLPLHALFAGESRTKPSHRLGPKVYDFYLMHIVLSGRGSFTLEGARHELGAGDTFLIKPEQLISYESHAADPWHYRWAAFAGAQAPLMVREAGFDSPGSQIVRLKDMRRAAALYSRIYGTFRAGGASASMQAAGYLQLLLAQYSEALHERESGPAPWKHRETDRLYRQVVHYLTTQYTHPVSIEAMAEALGYNRGYLSRLFKRHTGMSPVQFLLKLRVDKARQMLRERPELTVEQVAASVGIQDALYFSKQFRRFYGQSPTAYRTSVLHPSSDS